MKVEVKVKLELTAEETRALARALYMEGEPAEDIRQAAEEHVLEESSGWLYHAIGGGA
jgi:hypothetical protein